MNPSEYVLVFVSLVLGLAVADVLSSLHRLLRAGARVRWDWMSPVAAMMVLLAVLMLWWSYFPRGPSASLSIGAFLPVFVTVILTYLLAAAVLPDEVPPEGLDLKDFYRRSAPHFWSLMSLNLGQMLVWEAVGRVSTLGWGQLWAMLPARWLDLLFAALFVSLIFVRARAWHAAGLLAALAGPVAWLSLSIG